MCIVCEIATSSMHNFLIVYSVISSKIHVFIRINSISLPLYFYRLVKLLKTKIIPSRQFLLMPNFNVTIYCSKSTKCFDFVKMAFRICTIRCVKTCNARCFALDANEGDFCILKHFCANECCSKYNYQFSKGHIIAHAKDRCFCI